MHLSTPLAHAQDRLAKGALQPLHLLHLQPTRGCQLSGCGVAVELQPQAALRFADLRRGNEVISKLLGARLGKLLGLHCCCCACTQGR